MNKLLVFILFNLLMGCLPDTPVRDLTSDEQTVTTGDQSGITDVDEDYEADDLTWYHQGNYVQVLTLDVDNKLLGYLRGTAQLTLTLLIMKSQSSWLLPIHQRPMTTLNFTTYA
jgi:hypothetical protein